MQNTIAEAQNSSVHEHFSDDHGELAGIQLELEITDPESAAALISYPAGRQRDEFARQALRIGILSLRQAQGAVDGEKIRNEGERILGELASRLSHFQESTESSLTSTLQSRGQVLHNNTKPCNLLLWQDLFA